MKTLTPTLVKAHPHSVPDIVHVYTIINTSDSRLLLEGYSDFMMKGMQVILTVWRQRQTLQGVAEKSRNISCSQDVDAARLYAAMRTILEAPTLVKASSDSFAQDPIRLGDDVLAVLMELKLVHRVDHIEQMVVEFVEFQRRNFSVPESLQDIDRQLKTIDVRRRHAEEEAQKKRLLKSKTERWEDANRQQVLTKAYDDLVRRRHTLLQVQQNTGDKLMAIRELCDRDRKAAQIRWVAPALLSVSPTLEFLYEELSELNEDHFIGRSLADVLTIGPYLG